MRMPGVVTGTMVRWNQFMGKTRAPRCLIEANGMIVASNSSSGTVGCLFTAVSDPVPSGINIGCQSIQLGCYFV